MGKAASDELNIRKLGVGDAAEVQSAVLTCPPLTLHTPYTYWVILSRGRGFCVGAWQGGDLAAFLLALPFARDHVFVWQIGVRTEFQRQGLSQRLLEQVWGAAKEEGLGSLEATVEAGNQASLAAFSSFADSHALTLEREGDIVSRGPDGGIVDREVLLRLTAKVS